MVKGLIVGCTVLAVSVGFQLALFHVVRGRRALRLMGAALGPTLGAYVLIYTLIPPTLGVLPERLAATPFTLGLWNGVFILILLFLTWIQFYYHIDRSITLRLVTEFARAPNRSLTVGQIEKTCGLRLLIDRRMRALVSHGLVRRHGDVFFATRAGVVVAFAGYVARAVLRLRPF